MARIKLGAFLSSISGSIGGHTVQRSRFGTSLRTKPNSCTGQSTSQLNQRAFMLAVQNAWKSMSYTQRSAWHVSVNSVHAISRKDGSVTLTGRELFIRWNILLLSAGYPVNLTPDFTASYNIDSDFSLYADDLSFFAVFDVDPLVNNKDFLLNASRSVPANYSYANNNFKAIAPVSMGNGGFDLKESYLNQYAVLPIENDTVIGSIHTFSTVAPIDSPKRKFVKKVLPVSSLNFPTNMQPISDAYSQFAIYSLIMLSNGYVIAGTGNNGLILISLNNGQSFSNTGFISGSNAITTICELENGIVLAFGSTNGRIFRSVDYGVTWSFVSSPAGNASYWDSRYLGNGNVISVSGNGGLVFRSFDYGLTWVYSQAHSNVSAIRSICILPSGRIVCGTGNIGSVIYSDNIGQSWSFYFNSSLLGSLRFVHYVNESLLICLSGSNNDVYYSVDSGSSWHLLSSIPSFSLSWRCIGINNSYLIVACSSNGLLSISNDYGSSWNTFPPFTGISAIITLINLSNYSFLFGGGGSSILNRSNYFPNF